MDVPGCVWLSRALFVSGRLVFAVVELGDLFE